jgi:IS605 OrfB family transposase
LRKRLRWLRDWILPRGRNAEGDPAIRHVGGLSLTRIATIKSFYQVQKAFYMRPEPEDLRKNIPSKGDDALLDFGRSILDVMEHMREQRVKQLASRIAEAALGIGRMKRFAGGKDPKRPRERVDRPCHAVVIENLTHYRPDETRTRRENRQVMSWSSSKVKKYLAEACQLNGLHLREVQAGYTSRQDSRTGAPGVRCQDVPVKEFVQSPFWRKQVAQAEKKQDEGKGDARERFLCDLNAKWKGQPEADWEKAGAVRVPLKGGEIFVSADEKSPAAKGLQADLNAAANIGLRALTDPDWPGKWWYVPCDPTNFKPAKDKVAGSAAICLDKPLKNAPAAQDTDGPRKKRGKAGARSREVVNLWRDVSSQPISANDDWREFTPYWNDAQARVVNILRQSAGFARDQGER